MRAIFISYRREDTEGQAGRLFDDLAKLFGEQSVFMDVAGLEPGRDFRKAIDEHVASCGVLLAVIGKNWVDARDETGHRRLDDPLDFVRLETAAALKRDIPVVPVLVRGASMPRADQLPADLADLAFRNAIELTHARWDSDLTVLGKALSRYVTPSQPDAADRGSIERGVQTGSKPLEPASPRRVSLRAIGLVAIIAVLLTGAVGWWVSIPSFQTVRQEEVLQAAEAQKAEADRQAVAAQKEADRQAAAAQKAEADRQAAAAQKAEADRQAAAAQKAEADRQAAAAQKVEAQRKLEAERQSVSRPSGIQIGDTYIIDSQYPSSPKWNTTTERKVISISDGKIIVTAKNLESTNSKPRTLTFTPEWNLISSRNADGNGSDFSPPLQYFAFPLYPGKTWKQTSRETDVKTGAVKEHTLSGIVSNWEDVSVTAGTFRTIKITVQNELLDRATGIRSTGTDISWYAPNLRRSIKSEITSRDSQGSEQRQSLEVTEYELYLSVIAQ
jgi:hypothetical protein